MAERHSRLDWLRTALPLQSALPRLKTRRHTCLSRCPYPCFPSCPHSACRPHGSFLPRWRTAASLAVNWRPQVVGTAPQTSRLAQIVETSAAWRSLCPAGVVIDRSWLAASHRFCSNFPSLRVARATSSRRRTRKPVCAPGRRNRSPLSKTSAWIAGDGSSLDLATRSDSF
jgi:hypothetical protein